MNSIYSILHKITIAIFGLFSGVILARNYDAEIFGQYIYAMVIALTLTPLAKIGLNQILSRELLQSENKASILQWGLAIQLLLATIITILILIFCYIVLGEYPLGIGLNIWFMVAFFIVTQSFLLVDEYYYATKKCKKLFVIYLFFSVISLLAKYFISKSNLSISYIYLESTISNTIIFIFLSKKTGILRLRKINFSSYNKNIKPGLILTLAASAGYIQMKVDQLMIGYYLSKTDVAIYSIAAKFSEVWYLFAWAFVSAIMPKINQIKKQYGEIEYFRYCTLATSLLIIFGAVIAFLLVMFGRDIIILLYGNEYKESASILNIYCLGTIIYFSGVMVSRMCLFHGLEKQLLFRSHIGMISNISLNLLLIPRYGMIGAAYATVVTEIFVLLSYYLNKKTRSIAKIIINSPLVVFDKNLLSKLKKLCA